MNNWYASETLVRIKQARWLNEAAQERLINQVRERTVFRKKVSLGQRFGIRLVRLGKRLAMSRV